MKLQPTLFFLFLLNTWLLSAQSTLVTGVVSDESGIEIPGVSVTIEGTSKGTVTNVEGQFELEVPVKQNVTLVFTHIQYIPQRLTQAFDEETPLSIVLKEQTTQLQDVQIKDDRLGDLDEVVNFQKVDAKSAKALPSTFGDFNKVLVTLPGVSSNNELSSAYSVRGGNFDENLVYVNDIPVYRPFLANAGRQEGLSFVNPDMVQDIEFYAGGWEPKYGDKLSSSLNIEYKEPDSLEGAVTVGLLGGTAYTGGHSDRLSYLIGARHRDSRYLLGTLETQGQYFPTYTDIQSMLTFDLSKKGAQYINKTKLNVLLSYGRNRYVSIPESQTTDFGSVQANFRLNTYFEGREIMRYDTYQSGLRLTHRFTERLRAHFIGSAMYTSETEQYDVEGAYFLCDVNKDPNTSSFDQCVIVRGAGTNYDYGRNSLDAQLYTAENRWEYLLNVNHVLEAGAGVTIQQMNDQINEYEYIDSADYVNLQSSIFNDINLGARQYFGYVQNTLLWKDSIHALASGVRMTFWDYNGQLLVSPRISYRWAPKWKKTTTFKLAVGLYQQPPFYRELRDRDGLLRQNVYAQKSLHFIGGMTRLFEMWGRPFLFSADIYHKELYDVIPYDIDNVRLRYYPTLSGRAFARGVDFRVHGEFVKGTQSWFSLGLLQTQEKIDGVDDDYIRRPTDQRVNLAAYFEDHMPGDPSLRIYLNMVFGSGYPLGPPDRPELRNAFSGDEYYRADIGLSKRFEFRSNQMFNNIWLRIEVLNALAADNTLSYTWIEDVNGAQFAVPNSLSARFLNIKFTAEL
ncbi:TonB-dependent receptor [Marinoscillum furvescens]|uniref:TonB-dependent receptor-like protein n=1 Tax=Marinoscillum furvescens DSM 4134 TaxID=1122208 RepID=A0A3D9KY87_MARFU|nr:TonB-dependent receptor [Marinoscillum furvescens]RED94369.1 TonB-dependent receptor-like protein [Marinoscillum furvescens DSM 4134]